MNLIKAWDEKSVTASVLEQHWKIIYGLKGQKSKELLREN